MKRALAAAVLAAAALTSVPAAHAVPPPDHQCEGALDYYCRGGTCDVDELDCGMKICHVWVDERCVAQG